MSRVTNTNGSVKADRDDDNDDEWVTKTDKETLSCGDGEIRMNRTSDQLSTTGV